MSAGRPRYVSELGKELLSYKRQGKEKISAMAPIVVQMNCRRSES
jgi:hypothetical protein